MVITFDIPSRPEGFEDLAALYASRGCEVRPWAGPSFADRPLAEMDPSYAGTPIGAMRLEDAARLLGWIK